MPPGVCWDWLPGENPNWSGAVSVQGPRGDLRAWAPREGTNPPARAQEPLMGPLGLADAAQGLWLAPVITVPLVFAVPDTSLLKPLESLKW